MSEENRITFRIVDNSESRRAHQWHRAFASRHDAIYPRDERTFSNLVYDRSVWCAETSDGDYLAMSYAAFAEPEQQWEIGGLMVSEEARGKGLGSIMMRLPLVHMLVNEQPLAQTPRPRIVTHILAGNLGPRNIVPAVGFARTCSVEIPAAALPGLKADADGIIRGDEYDLAVPSALTSLSAWCDGWNGTLADGSAATIEFLEGSGIQDWAEALRSMIP